MFVIVRMTMADVNLLPTSFVHSQNNARAFTFAILSNATTWRNVCSARLQFRRPKEAHPLIRE